jgi:hypothetical protein
VATRGPIPITISLLAAGSTAYYIKGYFDEKTHP